MNATAEPLLARCWRSVPARLRSTATALAAIALGFAGGSGCGVAGPSCLDHQGAVTTISGSLEAGQIVTHTVTYDARGSENEIRIAWGGQRTPGGPRLWLYATGLDCEEFSPPPGNGPSADSGPCRTISGGGGGFPAPDARPCVHANTCQPTPDEMVTTSLIVFGQDHGRPVSGYKLHVVADRSQSASYAISITWWRDC